MGAAGAGVAEAGSADIGAGARDASGGAGDEEVDQWVGYSGRCAGYEERGGAV